MHKRLKATVYTCITKGYEISLPPAPAQDCINSCVLFTNDSSLVSPGWEVRRLVSSPRIKRADLINRYHKLFASTLFNDTDISVYIDGNIEIISNICPLIDSFLQSGKSFGCLKHPQRSNIIQELEACSKLGKFKEDDYAHAFDQVDAYLKDGFPLEMPLQAATILFRKHVQDPLLNEAMTLWWEQLNKYTCRDQLSLPYVLWKTALSFMSFDLDIFDNEYFIRHPHKQNKPNLPGLIKRRLALMLTRLRG